MRTTTIFAETHTSERANHVAYRLVIIISQYKDAIEVSNVKFSIRTHIVCWYQVANFINDRCVLAVITDFMYHYVVQVIKSLNPHKDFRLWMTAEVHPKFPTILLQSSLKITFEVCNAQQYDSITMHSPVHYMQQAMALHFEITC